MNKPTYLVAVLGMVACQTDASEGTALSTSTVAFHIERTEAANDGNPYFVTGSLGAASSRIDTLADVDAAMSGAIFDIGRAINVPADQLVASRVEHDQLGMTHIRYGQRANGLPVISGQVIVHIGADNVIKSVTNGTRDATNMPIRPTISAQDAIEVARTATPNVKASPTADLVYVIVNGEGEMHLAWRTDVTGRMQHDTVFVDGLSGSVVARHPHIQPAKSRTVFSTTDISNVQVGDLGMQVGTEAAPPTEETAKLAFDNTGVVYDFYKSEFARDSYDDAGAILTSVVHVTDNANGGPFDNAFWDGTEMVYGDGDGTVFTELVRALDVTAHELTHAVTERSAGLIYQDESGALNEASSDILGAACEAHRDGHVSANTWLVGEDIFTPTMPGDALRYMDNPTKDAALYANQPAGTCRSGTANVACRSQDFFAERLTGTFDQGGVHFNSGIANLFFYLASEGGTHPRSKTSFTVNGIGIEKAAQIWYRALTHYFTPSETFAQARTGIEMAAEELFPGSAKNVMSLAWASVGVGVAPPADVAPPTVSITSPTEGTNAKPGFTIKADVTDDTGIVRVDFSIDGVVVGSVDKAPFEVTADATVAFGDHMIEVTAYDVSNSATDQVAITLIDPTCGKKCTSDQTCDMDEGVCVDNGGCCSTGGSPAAPLLLFAGCAVVVMRRRRRS